MHAQGAFAFLHERLDLNMARGGLSWPYLGILAHGCINPPQNKWQLLQEDWRQMGNAYKVWDIKSEFGGVGGIGSDGSTEIRA
jgi:hypothetical protein